MHKGGVAVRLKLLLGRQVVGVAEWEETEALEVLYPLALFHLVEGAEEGS